MDMLKINMIMNAVLPCSMLFVLMACGKNDDEAIPQNLAPLDFETKAMTADAGTEITPTCEVTTICE